MHSDYVTTPKVEGEARACIVSSASTPRTPLRQTRRHHRNVPQARRALAEIPHEPPSRRRLSLVPTPLEDLLRTATKTVTVRSDMGTGLRWVAIAFAVLAIPAGSDAASGLGQEPPTWKLVYEHYDARRSEGRQGIDIVTSERALPLALARRRKGVAESYSDPELSPNGEYVAYRRSASGVEEFYVVRADGTAPRRLVAGREVDELVWSADSSSLAFTTRCASDFEGGCRNARIETVHRNGTNRRVLVRPEDLSRNADIELQDWSRRGELLYLIRDRGRERLYVVGATGRVSPALVDSRAEGDIGGASWSSDGQMIAYMRRCTELRDTYCDLAVMASNGGSKRTLVRRGRAATVTYPAPAYDAPTWIPGSRRLLVSLWGNSAETRLLDAATGASRRYSRVPWRDIAVSRDGARVATVDQPVVGVDHVLIKRLNGSTLERTALPRQVPDFFSGDHDFWIQ